MRRTNLVGQLLRVALLASWAISASAAPPFINFQGRLMDVAGAPVDGTVAMKLRVYDQASDGTLLWEEEHANLVVTGGLYQLELGSGTTTVGIFGPGVFSGDDRWLEVWVDGEPLSPRQYFTSVPYSFDARMVGEIIMWNGSIQNGHPVVDGAEDARWRLCDGTGGTPDLRGRFVVGVGGSYIKGATGGSNSIVLSKSQMPSHVHDVEATVSEDGDHAHDFQDTYFAAIDKDFLPAHNIFSAFNVLRDFSDSIFSLPDTTDEDGAHTHEFEGVALPTGSGASIDVRPPYSALVYLMYVGG